MLKARSSAALKHDVSNKLQCQNPLPDKGK